jgi:Co/Zn/Cd efflux system component
MMAAGGVLATDTGWPDLAVAALIAALSLSAALEVMKHALTELRTEQQ